MLLTQLREALNQKLIKHLEVVNPKHDPSQSYILVTLNPHTTHRTQMRLLMHIEAIYDLPVGLSNHNHEGQIYLTVQTPRLSESDLSIIQP